MSEERINRGSLLVVDDEDPQRLMLEKLLTRAGYQVVTAADGAEAIRRLEDASFDLLLTDQRMPNVDGLELLEKIQRDGPHLPVVLMTAHGSVSSAVQAMKRGAADYLTKPFERDELLVVIEKALRHRKIEEKLESLQGELRARYRLGNIIGQSPAMQAVFNLIERVSATDVQVMISGESGTGKEMVARAIHQNGSRAERSFVGINCAAIPETLLESEFFGHERGAFTGATRAHAGRFEQAHGGTLFLDEIGAMRFDLQAKLLRAIQEQEVQRLGSTRTRKIDVRIVAASSENLEQAIRNRTFREDLYYRLCVVPIHMPPVRERDDDIPLLVDHFLQRATKKFNRSSVRMAPEVLERLQRFSWPGNVRELENCIERMIVLSSGDRLTLSDLPLHLREGARAGAGSAAGFELPAAGVVLGDLEARLIEQALSRCRGSLGPAARLLGISYKTLQYRIRKYQLDDSLPQMKQADPI